MQPSQENLPAGYPSPKGWLRLETGGRTSYVDPGMLAKEDGSPLTRITYAQAHRILQIYGLRGADDLEHNMASENPEVAKQMKKFAVWTSCLKDVKRAKGGGYTAKLISRPVIAMVDGEYKVRGSEKPRKFPASGYFTEAHILQSEDGLPSETLQKMPDESFGYFSIAEGPERPVSRGGWSWYAHIQFNANARWGPFDSYSDVGFRGASDDEPNITFARMETLRAIYKEGL
jgi:hypothetical protein